MLVSESKWGPVNEPTPNNKKAKQRKSVGETVDVESTDEVSPKVRNPQKPVNQPDLEDTPRIPTTLFQEAWCKMADDFSFSN